MAASDNNTAQVANSPESLPGTYGPTDRAFDQVKAVMDYVPDQVSSHIAEYAGKQGMNPYLAAGIATPAYIAADPLNFIGVGEAGKAAEGAAKVGELALDQGSRMKRAAEMGYDTAKKWFHGTGSDFSEFRNATDPHLTETLLYGPGTYFTSSPKIAGEYAEASSKGTALETLGTHPSREDAFAQAAALQQEHGIASKDLSVYKTPDERYLVQGVQRRDSNIIPAYLKHGEFLNMDSTIRPGQLDAIIDGVGIHGTPEAMALKAGKPNGIRGSELYRYLNESAGLDKAAINKGLASAGYDGIEHTGGLMLGKTKHQVRVVFDPSNIRSPAAAFDKAKSGSANILASVTAALLGAGATSSNKEGN